MGNPSMIDKFCKWFKAPSIAVANFAQGNVIHIYVDHDGTMSREDVEENIRKVQSGEIGLKTVKPDREKFEKEKQLRRNK